LLETVFFYIIKVSLKSAKKLKQKLIV